MTDSLEVERVISICVFRRGNRILAARGYDDVADEYFFRPIGGRVEAGESPEQALHREVREETGLAIRDLVPLGVLDNRFTYRGEPHRESVAVFDASFVDPAIYDLAHVEIQEDVWEGPAQWLDLEEPPPEPIYPEGLLHLLGMAH